MSDFKPFDAHVIINNDQRPKTWLKNSSGVNSSVNDVKLKQVVIDSPFETGKGNFRSINHQNESS